MSYRGTPWSMSTYYQRRADGVPLDAPDRRCPPLPEDVAGIGPQIRAHRLAQGLAQWDLAILTGQHQKNVSQHERGRWRPRPATVAAYERALGVRFTEGDR